MSEFLNKRPPFAVDNITYDQFANERRMTVAVREYPAGALLEFDLSNEQRDEILSLVLDAHAAKVFRLAKKATDEQQTS